MVVGGAPVTAVADTGYTFNQWSDGVATATRTDTAVTGNLSVTALFNLNQYTLAYSASTGGSINGTTPQIVSHGSDGSAVTAVPSAGYRFLQWSDDNPDATRTESNVTSDITVIASFATLPAPTNVQASAGNEEVVISWDAVEDTSSYNLYYATQTIADIGSYASYANGTLVLGATSPYTVTGLINGTEHFFRVTATANPGESLASAQVTAMPAAPPTISFPIGGLNDTGIDWCADSATNLDASGTAAQKQAGCTSVAASHPSQDGMVGRDARARAGTLVKIGGGEAGFDFTKVCNSGQIAGEGDCPEDPDLGLDTNEWACTRDNVTGLIWEVKVNGSHLRSMNHRYSWYNTNWFTNGGSLGAANGGTCTGSNCDTQAFVAAVNVEGLCGASDWRLPTIGELLSIVHRGHSSNPVIDATYFPNVLSVGFWSASPVPDRTSSAWFLLGNIIVAEGKGSNRKVMLVRAAQ